MIRRISSPSRRVFLSGASVLGVSTLFGPALAAPRARKGISVGYASITWGDRSVRTAIEEIAAAGYSGIQLRAGSTKPKSDKGEGTLSLMDEFKTPEALKAELEKHKLTFACVSGGGLTIDPAKKAAEMEKFVQLAKFSRAAGALAIQATSPNRGGKTPEPSVLKFFGEMLEEVGKQTAAIGLPLVFHNHMNQIGEQPQEVAAILAATTPANVKVLLDTGHWAAAGADPVAAVRTYGKRIQVLHIKDVKDKEPGVGADGKPGKKYEFVELGQGKVDFKGVFKALKATGFNGWAVVELDSVPDGRAPKDAAAANREFLEKKVGIKVSPTLG